MAYAVVAPPLDEIKARVWPDGSVDGVLQLHAHPVVSVSPDLAESVAALRRWSALPVWSVNTRLGFPRGLARLRFRAVVLHYSLFYSALAPLTDKFLDWLGQTTDGTYVLALFQDEQAYTVQRFDFCRDYRVDSIYTCLAQPEARALYGRYTPVKRFVSYHPGYVSERLVAASARFGKPDPARKIDVGYRGRRLPGVWGGAAAEKWQIGVEFEKRAMDSGLTLDISVDEDDRLYGDAWYRFLADCRSVLGTESGASRFDTSGALSADAHELGSTAEVAADATTEIAYRTISPRHLEAAAFRCCQVLYEGEYAGVLEPDLHYVPLKKDFSNFDEVVEQLRDPARRGELAANARRDLIDSGELSYERLVGAIEAELRAAGVSGAADVQQVRRSLYPPRLARAARHASLATYTKAMEKPRVAAAVARLRGRS